eukprot:c6292_g1_i1.p1 GENE.c6292_g1_i1~~c6292_g1_i1.p1  ORF type:complete len:502 (-),score=114.46 c6292_g1_i1:22-1479(-)
MISSLTWVARGASKANPTEYKPTEAEIEKMKAEVAEYDAEEDGAEDEEMAEAPTPTEPLRPELRDDPDLAEFKMDEYDNEDGGVMMTGAGMKGLTYFENQGDPYVVMNDDTDESEADDWVIRPTDSLIICAKTDDDVPTLEVHVHEGDADHNTYCHHEMIMTAFPLCVSWLSFNPTQAALGEKGNFVAVGTFHPGIEIWDLDVVDAPTPVATLGGHEPVAPIAEPAEPAAPESGKKKKKKSKKPKEAKAEPALRPGSHSDAVMSLSWNALQRNVLASGSADTTVKMWDIASSQCVTTFSHHNDKVQCCLWHPIEASVLATASYDRTVHVFDVRSQARGASTWRITADAECLTWNPHQPHQVFVSSEDGRLVCIDVRDASKVLYTLQAHNSATNSISFDRFVPNLMATGSIDKSIKLWDTSGSKPSLLDTITSDIGTVFTLGFCVDEPFVLAAAGGKGKLNVIDCFKRAKVQSHYAAWYNTFTSSK